MEPNSTDTIPHRSSSAKLVGIATAGLAGLTVGALWLGPTVSGAQEEGDDTTTTEQPATDEETDEATDEERCAGHGPGHLRHFAFLDTAAETIGIEPSELRAALEDGQTIAEVAEANGVDPATVIDAMVAEAQARLDDRAENLEERITDLVNGELSFRHEGRPGHEAEDDSGS
ncbi:MAG: hypothetical protein ACRD0G_04235 [Acidimicrobiales bacterium]